MRFKKDFTVFQPAAFHVRGRVEKMPKYFRVMFWPMAQGVNLQGFRETVPQDETIWSHEFSELFLISDECIKRGLIFRIIAGADIKLSENLLSFMESVNKSWKKKYDTKVIFTLAHLISPGGQNCFIGE